MPLHRSNHGLSRAVWTIRNGMQVAKMAYKGIKAVKAKRAAARAEANHPAAVKKVRARLGTINPAYAGANRAKYYSKDNPAGQNRRKKFAEQLRKARPKASAKPTFTRKPYSGKIALSKSMTGAQVKRNIVRHKIKSYTAGLYTKATGAGVKPKKGQNLNINQARRIQVARQIKALRSQTQTKDYSRTTGTNETRRAFKIKEHPTYVKAASRILSKLNKK